jgi:glyoxylase-like metal-dependent hydrolase (beta-lactamase superfamily II)
MTGFRNFISSWFFVDSHGRRVVVDPGPASSIPALIKELDSVTDGLDFVLLTHIHIDHSGGLGHLLERYGGAKVIAHPKAGRHLTAPEKLWKASLATLGRVAEMYGPPKPIPQSALTDYGELPGVEVIATPGHAPHHITFVTSVQGQRLFFVGEAAGLRIPLPPGIPYLRPTTPPKFDMPAALESLDKLEAAVVDGDVLCYAHWGAARNPKPQLTAVKAQVREWLNAVSQMENLPVEEIAGCMLDSDPLLAGYRELPEDLRSRERFFIENAVAGYLDYIQDAKKKTA